MFSNLSLNIFVKVQSAANSFVSIDSSAKEVKNEKINQSKSNNHILSKVGVWHKDPNPCPCHVDIGMFGEVEESKHHSSKDKIGEGKFSQRRFRVHFLAQKWSARSLM